MLYAGAVPIDETTVVRAAAFMDGATPSPIVTHTYIFPADVIRQSPETLIAGGWPSDWGGRPVDMGLDPNIVEGQEEQLIAALFSAPSISLVLPFDSLFSTDRGIFVNSKEKGRKWERPVSVELIYPPDFFDEIGQGSQHGDQDGFAVNAGLRIRGGGNGRSHANPKHSLRLYFRGSYGPKNLKYALFGDEGVSEFDKIDLRGETNFSWSFQGSRHHTLMRDVFSRDTQCDMGLPCTRSRYYHLYLNGQYWGVYQTQERADQWHGEFYIRGDKDDYDVVKADGGRIGFSEGNEEAWLLLYEEANKLAQLVDDQERDVLYMKLQGKNPDGTPNSEYPVLLDVDNLIHYMLIIFWTADRDAPILVNNESATNNWIGMRDRKGDQGFTFFIHDAEFALFPGHDRTGPFVAGEDYKYSNPQWIHQQLMGAGNYRQRFAELAHQHFFGEGALSNSSVIARWSARENEVRPIIIAESARWGDSKSDPAKTPEDWTKAIDFIRKEFFPSRTAIVIEQLSQAKRWEYGRSSDALVAAPLYGDVYTSITNVNVPESLALTNYPNPFADEMTLQFRTEKPTNVRLEMFDVLGRRVTLVSEQFYGSGMHRVQVDGTDLPSGVYFVRMEADGRQVRTQKVIRR